MGGTASPEKQLYSQNMSDMKACRRRVRMKLVINTLSVKVFTAGVYRTDVVVAA